MKTKDPEMETYAKCSADSQKDRCTREKTKQISYDKMLDLEVNYVPY